MKRSDAKENDVAAAAPNLIRELIRSIKCCQTLMAPHEKTTKIINIFAGKVDGMESKL